MSKKWFIISLSICISISITFTFMFKLDNEKIKIDKNNNYVIDTDKHNYYIDFLEKNEKYITITGWFLEKDEALVYVNREVVLQDEYGMVYKINTNMVNRPDVTEALKNGINYDKCGFNARGKVSDLKENTEYKIGILYSNQDGIKKLFITDKIIKL